MSEVRELIILARQYASWMEPSEWVASTYITDLCDELDKHVE